MTIFDFVFLMLGLAAIVGLWRNYLYHLRTCEDLDCLKAARTMGLDQEWPRGRVVRDNDDRDATGRWAAGTIPVLPCCHAMMKTILKPPFYVLGGFWRCTRPEHHEGDHVAANNDYWRPIMARWNNEV
jgi:hypothetical protein